MNCPDCGMVFVDSDGGWMAWEKHHFKEHMSQDEKESVVKDTF